MQVNPMEARRIVEDDLSHMGYRLDQMVTQDELLQILDRRTGGRQFDRNVAHQLIEQINKDYYGRFPLRDFVEVYLEARQILSQKMFETSESIDNFERQKHETLDQLRDHQRDERLNSYGIMNDSVLIVHELEITNQDSANNHELSVRVNCEGASMQTQKQFYRGGARWDEQFKMEIKTGLDDVQLIVYLSEGPQYNHILGGVGIPLERLRDQHRHEEWFDLFDENGHVTQGKLHVSLHWIHSRVKYLSDLIRGWDEHMENLHQDQADYKRDLNILHEAFPALSGEKKQFTFEDPKHTTESYKSPPKFDNYPSLNDNAFGNPSQHAHQYRQAEAPPPQQQPKKQQVQPQPQPQPQYQTQSQPHGLQLRILNLSSWIGFVLSILLIIFGTLSCFVRTSFLDILLGLAFLASFDLQKKFAGAGQRVRLLFYAMIFGFLIEFFYLATYLNRWRQREDYESTNAEIIFELIVRGSAFIIKALLIICLFAVLRFTRPTENPTLTHNFVESPKFRS